MRRRWRTWPPDEPVVNLPLPARWVRRPLALLVVLGLAFAATLLPLLVLAAIAASLVLPGRWRVLRLLAFVLVYLLLEVVGLAIAFGLWVASGFGWKIRSPLFQRAHYAVLNGLLAEVLLTATVLFHLRIDTDGVSWSPVEDGVPGSTNAMVVLSRHAGPGDSLLLVRTLEDALLIVPEGGNFTEARRLRAIDRLRGRGMEEQARRAEALRNVLPPRSGGVAAALQSAPHADVVFVAHTGLEHLSTPADLWDGLPMDSTVTLRWWFVPAAEVPREAAAQEQWLYQRWSVIDEWIAANRPA
jgi:hypothetical protein